MERIQIDGSFGEGGGQILRSALGLSLVTGRPFDIHNIRARRRKPGLMRQHLTAVQAAATISNAKVEGAEIGSKILSFVPGDVRPGEYRFAVGTAGSATLVFQTILPALLQVGSSRVAFEGGTHNPWAPPYPFIEKAFLPILRRMGADVDMTLERHGFYPAGGGRFVATFGEAQPLRPVELLDRRKFVRRLAIAKVAQLDLSIAKRELTVVQERLGFGREECVAMEVKDSAGPGNILTLEFEDQNGACEVFTGFGEVRRPAEVVAKNAIRDARNWIRGDVPVGEFLADQLLLPFALAGGGAFRTLPLSRHSVTNMRIVGEFTGVGIEAENSGRITTVRFSPGDIHSG